MKTDEKKGRDLKEKNIGVGNEGINDVTKSARDVIRNQNADQKGLMAIGDICIFIPKCFFIPRFLSSNFEG